MSMFSEILNAIARLNAAIINRQAASEANILAAVNRAIAAADNATAQVAVQGAKVGQGQADIVALVINLAKQQSEAIGLLAAEQLKQAALLQKILTAVTLPPAVKAILAFEVEGKTIDEGEHIDMKVAMNMTGLLAVALLNAAGGPGQVDGIPTWKAAPEGVVTLTPAPDGMSCQVTTLPLAAGAPAASTVITFDADADLGDGVKDLVATAAITVFDPANDAVSAEITVGAFTPIAQG
jgi:hypothetical protein